jgi:hypothetical protein
MGMSSIEVEASEEELDKKHVALSQIETAIKLYFEDRDLVSCYALGAAAKEITENILRMMKKERDDTSDAGETSFSFDELFDTVVKPEFRDEIRGILRAPQNYLKHADKDHDKKIDARFLGLCPFLILGTIHNIVRLDWKMPPSFYLFTSYMVRYHSDLFNVPESLRERLDEVCTRITMPDGTETKRLVYQVLKKTSRGLFIDEDVFGLPGAEKMIFRAV